MEVKLTGAVLGARDGRASKKRDMVTGLRVLEQGIEVDCGW